PTINHPTVRRFIAHLQPTPACQNGVGVHQCVDRSVFSLLISSTTCSTPGVESGPTRPKRSQIDRDTWSCVNEPAAAPAVAARVDELPLESATGVEPAREKTEKANPIADGDRLQPKTVDNTPPSRWRVPHS